MAEGQATVLLLLYTAALSLCRASTIANSTRVKHHRSSADAHAIQKHKQNRRQLSCTAMSRLVGMWRRSAESSQPRYKKVQRRAESITCRSTHLRQVFAGPTSSVRDGELNIKRL
ncbi:hypothetical protein C7974DRAFT_399792 [Boeremia exigua]|uniref:uncharacterized protein n=1 Tax=Boeremia exigua TaxID=749465 RepID=UPI001E8E63BA|nr:uncharacterized protein C7974DRAFT_399792 [Boeremia exigua]KAH6620473.1 hypothetical protein C7974DRAFT_399792 [Boeremia exigua]